MNNQVTQLAPEVLTYTRDNLGRVTAAGAYARNLVYDPAGQLTSADIYSGSGNTWWTETRTYNVLGQLTRQTVASWETAKAPLAGTPRLQVYARYSSDRSFCDQVDSLVAASQSFPDRKFVYRLQGDNSSTFANSLFHKVGFQLPESVQRNLLEQAPGWGGLISW